MRKFNDIEKSNMILSIITTLIIIAILMNVFRDEINGTYFKTEIKNK